MSRTYHHGERRIRVRGVKKDPPDLRRIARALIALAQAEAEAAAQADCNDAEAEAIPLASPPSKPPTTTKKAAADPDNHEDAA